MFIIISGARFIIKSLNPILPRLAIIRFGGSPIIVAVPPIFDINI